MVIGKPGSGSTTFLKVIANMHDEYEEFGGTVTYGGVDTADLAKQRPGEVAFAVGENTLYRVLYSRL